MLMPAPPSLPTMAPRLPSLSGSMTPRTSSSVVSELFSTKVFRAVAGLSTIIRTALGPPITGAVKATMLWDCQRCGWPSGPYSKRLTIGPVSLVSPLTLTVPRIAYCVIHQRQPEVPQDNYVKILTELTRQAGKRSEEATQRIRSWRDARAAEAVQGASPEVGKRVRSLLEQVSPMPAVEAGLELATTDGKFPDGRLHQLAAAGPEYLASLGFRTASGGGPGHYSILIFTGSLDYHISE